jgi:hypothetical protein
MDSQIFACVTYSAKLVKNGDKQTKINSKYVCTSCVKQLPYSAFISETWYGCKWTLETIAI